MYELILALRPSVLDDLGLAAALRSHAERVLNGSGVTFKLDSWIDQTSPPRSRLLTAFSGGFEQCCQAFGADQVKITHCPAMAFSRVRF
jgi:glucose-6-phosphate-specific signal transduction histidine kinase